MRNPAPNGIPHEHLAALSHEFRTPLNGVIGMARLLELTRLTEEQRAYVAALTESGEHLLGLVNDVLDYARLGAGAVELNRGLVAPEDLMRQVCELLSPKAHEKGVEIGWAAEADLAPVTADEGRLRQILLNLAGNAVKFVDTGGVLVLAQKTATGDLRFTVSDTGPGVPRAERARIFQAFSQGASGRHAHQVGAGLGLAIAARLADAMGGRLGVGGVEGEGADFWFEAAFEAAEPGPATPSLVGRTVAVASASAIVREAASRQIEASGGRAVRAESVDQAVAQTDDGDAILVDHALASGDGAAGAALRARDRDPAQAGGTRADRALPRSRLQRLSDQAAAARLAGRARDAGRQVAGPRRPHRPPRPPAPTADGVRVLLAEDNPINAMLARTLLRREGAEVEHVESGEAALAALAAGGFDLVLMDVRMPGMGGLAATRSLQGAGRQRTCGGAHRQCVRGRSPRLPRGGHGRFPGQAAEPGGAARRPRTLDRPRLDAGGDAGQGRLLEASLRRPRVPQARLGAGMTATAAPVGPPRKRRMWDVFAALGRPRVGLMLLLGVSSGLPFMLIGNTLGFWLADDGIKLATIGALSWVGLDLHRQVCLGRDGRPVADPADRAARPTPQLDARQPDRGRWRPDRHGPDGPARPSSAGWWPARSWRPSAPRRRTRRWTLGGSRSPPTPTS